MTSGSQLSKYGIILHVNAFTDYAQSFAQHNHFSPCLLWWTVVETKCIAQCIPHTIVFLYQIGVNVTETAIAFGKYWKSNLEKSFPNLCIWNYLQGTRPEFKERSTKQKQRAMAMTQHNYNNEQCDA